MDTYIITTTKAGAAGKNSLETRVNNIMAAWELQAPEAKFAGMTLMEFRLAVDPATQARQRKRQLRLDMKAAFRASAMADIPCRVLTDRVVASVKAESAYGPDSPLYRAMGFVPKSELKRKRNQQQQQQAAVPTPAAGSSVG